MVFHGNTVEIQNLKAGLVTSEKPCTTVDDYEIEEGEIIVSNNYFHGHKDEASPGDENLLSFKTNLNVTIASNVFKTAVPNFTAREVGWIIYVLVITRCD